MSNIDNYYPSSLTLVAATKCNLACKYCKINNSINSNSDKIFKETVKALQDGTYLKNVQIAFNRLNYSLNNIVEFQIWGQEPTLVLPYITEHWADWSSILPNLEKTMFSTNAIHCVDEIYDFIIEANKYATTPLHMTFQISYDGYLVPLNTKYFRVDPVEFGFKYGGEITCVGMVTNIVGKDTEPNDSNNIFATLQHTSSEILRGLLPTKSDNLCILHPIAIYYGN